MKLPVYVLFFAFVLATSSAISFVGYRYLGMANEYREANFEQLDAVYTATYQIRGYRVTSPSDLAKLDSLIAIMRDKAEWCISNLGAVDTVLFRALGASDAIAICHDAIKSAAIAKDALDALTRLHNGSGIGSPNTAIEIKTAYTQLAAEVEHLLVLSQSFQPNVTLIQHTLEVLVKSGTAIVSVILLLLSGLAAAQLVRAQDRLSKQSVTDALTGLLNRRGFDRALSDVRDTPNLMLARIDLDRFKQVNDILGHDAGDFVLSHVADLMRKHARPKDTLARIGGDEFVILFAENTSKAAASQMIEALFADINLPLRYGDKQCIYGASFGLASTEIKGLKAEDLLNAADKALYEVKRSGRGAVSIYSKEMHNAAVQERGLADRFRHALQNREIVPYFHSQHFAEDSSLFGLEVLARWEHPTIGLLTPDKFLGIANQLGMEADLDRVIFDQTVELLRALDQEGLDVPRVAFNVSAGRITDPNFITDIRDKITENRDRFAFEILESVSYEDSSEILQYTVDVIKDMGFQIDVDDFGSGHASINSVLNIAPHALKIDRHIIQPISDSIGAYRMTASIVELANALNMTVIAEGVDTAEKAALLRKIGCQALQGFLFSRPMPAADLRAFLQSARAAAPEPDQGKRAG